MKALPSRAECLEMLEAQSILPNILEHTLAVNRIAVTLAKALKSAGEQIDVELIDRASLLHDIAKTAEIKQKIIGVWHNKAGAELLKQWPSIANLVLKHALTEIENCKTWAEKIIQYADLRVEHSTVVSLAERFECLKKRYGSKHSGAVEHFNRLAPFAHAIEKEIFEKLDKLSVDELI